MSDASLPDRLYHSLTGQYFECWRMPVGSASGDHEAAVWTGHHTGQVITQDRQRERK